MTPTGAAILAGTVESYGELPPMRVARAGYGAGTRELEIPNVMRLLVGEPATEQDTFGPVSCVLLETNIDDMNPELYEYVLERLFGAGAQDAWITPIVMKHGRPAAQLSILTGHGEELACRNVVFEETTTLGIRRTTAEKWLQPREIVTVELPEGVVRVKVARGPGGVVNVAPEYADCVRAARESGRPLKEIYGAAQMRARTLLES